MTKIIPHDELFKSIMADHVAAKEFLEHYLPEEFKQMVDLADVNNIKVENSSFIDENLKKRFNDVLYSIKLKDSAEPAFAYVLIENQSTPDPMIALRLWRYMLLLAETYLGKYESGENDEGIDKDDTEDNDEGQSENQGKKHGQHQIRQIGQIGNNDRANSNLGGSKSKLKKIPLIIPVVVYNGTRKYKVARNLWEMFANPALAKQLMTEDYKLVDLQAMPDEEIKKKQHLGMLEYFLKHIHDREILEILQWSLEYFKEVVRTDKKYDYFYIRRFLCYIEAKVPEEKQQEIVKILKKYLAKDEQEQLMRTIAQKYIEEGIEQGIVQGINLGVEKGINIGVEEGIRKTAINLLKHHAEISFVATVTGLSTDQIIKLKSTL